MLRKTKRYLSPFLHLAWPVVAGLIVLVTLTSTSLANFTPVTAQAGVDFQHGTLASPIPSSPLYYAGDLAVTDLNNDGWLDLYATRLSGGNLMFINNRDGTFTDEAGARGLTGPATFNGASFADIDNDGDTDLLLPVIDSPRYYAYLNQGDGTFVEQAELRAIATIDLAQPHAGMSVTAGDYDRDGYLDLHFNDHYLNKPGINPLTHSVLLQNRGSAQPGFFTAAENQNWMTHSAASAIESLAQHIGNFPFAANAEDSALHVTLDPGVYTAQMSDHSLTESGIGLLEIYWIK